MKYLKIFPAGLTDSLTKKSLRNLCPADVCPAEFQISCGAGRHNAEPDSQYGRPYRAAGAFRLAGLRP